MQADLHCVSLLRTLAFYRSCPYGMSSGGMMARRIHSLCWVVHWSPRWFPRWAINCATWPAPTMRMRTQDGNSGWLNRRLDAAACPPIH